MSIVVSRETTYYAIYSGIMGLGIAELLGIELIDVYEGEKIPKGSISLTLRLTFQDPEKTLTVDRVQGFIDAILSLLTKSFGAGLRSL
jgi:phenylalanyl-tRNA synthetase beta chain